MSYLKRPCGCDIALHSEADSDTCTGWNQKDFIHKVGFTAPKNAREKKYSRPICGHRHTKKDPVPVSDDWASITCKRCLMLDPTDMAHNHPLLRKP